MYKREKCGEKYCESIPYKSGTKNICISGRRYGQFCSALEGAFTGGEAECGVDGNGKKMVCKVMLDFNKMNACRYEDGSQEVGDFCGKEEECTDKN